MVVMAMLPYSLKGTSVTTIPQGTALETSDERIINSIDLVSGDSLIYQTKVVGALSISSSLTPLR